ncbi:UNVERIFIED_CONTAM: hypothetical protein Sradi_5248900 [Sesamum radiatum]|uniref:SWIM-type domain-containing protein n=1 Tax=Sesamum radiatum TaxID=300843 RepID=A0AAW2LL20_SESRA
MNKGFKLLIDDSDIKLQALKHVGGPELEVFVEDDIEMGVSKHTDEGDRGKGIMLSEPDDGHRLEINEDGDSILDSDYDMVSGNNDDDDLFDKYVDGEGDMVRDNSQSNLGLGDSGDDSSDKDVVDSENDFDEARWLSEKYIQKFKSDPNRNVKGFRVDVMNELRLHVSKDQAYRAKKLALKKLEGSPEYQYSRLWDYAEEVRKTNHGSTVILGTENENGDFCVNLEKMTCTCRKWDISGIPCKHAVSAIFNQNEMPEDYVHDYYTVDMYKKAYAPVIMGTSGEMLWEHSLFIPPLPPSFGRGSGRPSNARRREPDEATNKRKKKTTGRKEMRLKRQQATVHCTICGEAGHNQRLCPFKEGSASAETLEGMQKVRKVSRSSKPSIDKILKRRNEKLT